MALAVLGHAPSIAPAMRISVIAVGRLRPPFQDDVEHYKKLLAGHARVELVEVREDEQVPARIQERAHVVLLASDGSEFDSVELAAGSRSAARGPRPLLRDRRPARARPRQVRHAALARADDAARTSSPAWCSWSSSTARTRSSPASRITISRGMDPVAHLTTAVEDAAAELAGNGRRATLKLERPPRADFGDYSTNAAMLLAPSLGEPPRAMAEQLGDRLGERLGEAVERVEVAGPGFLNLFMTDAWYLETLARCVEAGDDYGAGGGGERVNLEFVSANPTGPITVASARHAAYGDSLARILELAGHEVEREYYVNDSGTQVRRFGESIRRGRAARSRRRTATTASTWPSWRSGSTARPRAIPTSSRCRASS